MTLDQLRAFSAVVKFGSVRAASSRIFKSSPSISASIKALESYLDVQLFSREGYRLVLTDEGMVFHKKAEQVLHSASELTSLSKVSKTKRTRTISIAVNAYFPASSTIRIVSKMNESFPDMRLHIFTENKEDAVHSLFDETAELAITPLAKSVNQNVEVKYLKTVPLISVVKADSQLAKWRRPISEAEISKVPHVVYSHVNNRLTNKIELVPHEKRFWVNDINTKYALIKSGLGWGQLPEHMITSELVKGALVKLNIENYQDHSSEVFLVRRADRPLGHIAQNVWDCLDPSLV